jgi:elongator complex protein 3
MGRPRTIDSEAFQQHLPAMRAVLHEVRQLPGLDHRELHQILRRHPRNGNGMFSKTQLVRAYRWLVEQGELEPDPELLRRLQLKPVRTISGVTPVTVLTKPHPCPGRCIFCPTDVRMPKSYLHDEPGAMRAEQHAFDPFDQTAARLEAFEANGHGADKVELLVLGGTWSSYPREYQEWFLRRCFDAMNGVGSPSLEQAQRRNETAQRRNVGLVLETRPDHVNPREIQWLRKLGATKIQMGAQSLDDRILELNRRGHSVEQTRRAMTLLRAAGFKLVLHWMPNLRGATVDGDLEDFQRLFADPGLRPDEIKIYSTALLPNAELYDHWQRGEYQPYPDEELLELVLRCKQQVPRYCRINRVYRDIPSTNIVAGCKLTNMRQVLHERMRTEGRRCLCIRCREIRGGQVVPDELSANEIVYATRASEERFLSFDSADDRLAGYLRLSLPHEPGRVESVELGLDGLQDAAVVREVHVYGPALQIGRDSDGRAQHQGLGRRLLRRAERIAAVRGFARLAVIASVGTRAYYGRHGYRREGTYMVKQLRADVVAGQA